MVDAVFQLESDDRGRASTAVVLPCGADQFSQFIASLLGRPQELTGARAGQFTVDKAEAIQLHRLLTQRVMQQHGIHPLQFTARIGFDNGTSVLLNTVEDFEAYHEVRSVRSMALFLSWTFLINFPGALTPEKQEIEFSFIAEGGMRFSNIAPVQRSGEGYVQYRIRHTARTWGADIESLFSHYMDTLMKPETKLRKALRENSGLVGVGVGLSLFLGLIGGLAYANSGLVEAQKTMLAPMLGTSVATVDKLDYIIAFMSAGRDAMTSLYTTLYLLVSTIGSFAAGIIVGVQAETHPPSDVVLTKRAEQVSTERKTAYERSLRRVFISVLAAYTIGVTVNITYDFLLKGVVERSLKGTVSSSGKAPT